MQATTAAKKGKRPKSRRGGEPEAKATRATSPPGERHQNEGHGRRLTKAFEALEAFPALAESRDRLLAVIAKDHIATADIVAAVESDVALIIAVLRLANRAEANRAHNSRALVGRPRSGSAKAGRSQAVRAQEPRGRVETAVAAVEILSPDTVSALATRVRTFDFFERASVWDAAPERFRLHALATQHAADRIAAEVGYESRDRLTVTSLLHDIGKLVLIHAYPGYPSQVHRGARTPEERIHQERRELGVDHALVGGVLIRRWGLPGGLATPIERHHNPEADGEAAFIRLADMLAHYVHGGRVSPSEMLQSARAVGLGPEELRRVMYELPGSTTQRQRHVDPCPLSGRELGVLQRLAEGKVYKQIAHELTLSTSTVRTHLHNIYGKLGAVDRAQAVLIATERGWL
ncbi:MAG TPA: HDOD domain-containing protein [Solirubrobacteraceae bacterium]|nr:HDOD domain-containing protein [Solirubrobacteraceae bacterium]